MSLHEEAFLRGNVPTKITVYPSGRLTVEMNILEASRSGHSIQLQCQIANVQQKQYFFTEF